MAFVEKSGTNRWRVRYPKDDGGFGSISGFTSKKAAQDKADDIEAEQRRGTFLDPDAGKLSLAEWSVTWFDSIDVAATTSAQYRSLARESDVQSGGGSRSFSVALLRQPAEQLVLRINYYDRAEVVERLEVALVVLGADDSRLDVLLHNAAVIETLVEFLCHSRGNLADEGTLDQGFG